MAMGKKGGEEPGRNNESERSQDWERLRNII